jgi:predicted AAA+ superfamily ATPase
METIIQPFGFREFLRHRHEEPSTEPAAWTPAGRSLVEKRFREFLEQGGFPEAQGLPTELRVELLQGYVDAVLFRDIVERHGVSQVAALRWMVRHALRNPAGSFSAHKFHGDLKAQGLSVGKDVVHAFLGHLEDVFLLSAVPVATESERRQNSNPKKLYPVDPAMIGAFDASARTNVGHALETVVWNELDRRRAEVGYVRTRDGFEVDFLARCRSGISELIQVCADPSAPQTLGRELRALERASVEHPDAVPYLLVMTQDDVLAAHAAGVDPDGVRIQPVHTWILEGNASTAKADPPR